MPAGRFVWINVAGRWLSCISVWSDTLRQVVGAFQAGLVACCADGVAGFLDVEYAAIGVGR